MILHEFNTEYREIEPDLMLMWQVIKCHWGRRKENAGEGAASAQINMQTMPGISSVLGRSMDMHPPHSFGHQPLQHPIVPGHITCQVGKQGTEGE